jgi:hypothetical protein
MTAILSCLGQSRRDVGVMDQPIDEETRVEPGEVVVVPDLVRQLARHLGRKIPDA